LQGSVLASPPITRAELRLALRASLTTAETFGRRRRCQVKRKLTRSHYGRTFANHWEFIRFAKEQHLDLHFTTPPKRPARP
jgi:hypothetical protein